MTMLSNEQLHQSNPGLAGWTPTPMAATQVPGFVPGPMQSQHSAFQYPPTIPAQPGAMPYVSYAPPAPPAPPAPAAVSPSAPGQGLTAKLTPASVLMIVLLAVGGWYYYQHHQKPTPAPTPVTQGGGSSGQGGSQGQGSGQGGSQGSGSGQGSSQGSGSGQTSLSSADAQLLTHVPTDFQTSCRADQLQGASAALQCSTSDESGNVVVVYGQFTADSLDAAFAAQADGLHYVPVGNCTTGECTYGGTASSPSGKVDWFSTQASSGPLVGAVWTDPASSIVAIAAQSGTDITPLATWWQGDSGPN